MNIPPIPETNVFASKLLEYAQSILGYSYKTIFNEYSNKEIVKFSERQCKIDLESATIIYISNIYDIYDICIINFISSKYYNENLENYLKKKSSQIWNDSNNTMFQLYTNYKGIKGVRICLEPLRKEEKQR